MAKARKRAVVTAVLKMREERNVETEASVSVWPEFPSLLSDIFFCCLRVCLRGKRIHS